MTALTMPARPDSGEASLRPIPWRRMAGVTGASTGSRWPAWPCCWARSMYLWTAGLPLHHAYAAAVACHPATSAVCQGLDATLAGMDNFLSNGFILQVLPC